MAGRLLGGFIVLTALVAGIALYYLQVFAFYDEVEPSGTDDVVLTLLGGDTVEPILYEDFRAIDAESSPIRYRACFTTPQSQALLTETYEVLDGAEPRVAPGWFECFDAERIGEDLESGAALPFMGVRNVEYGIDRIVAIYPDGRGYAWHEINRCGEVVFDGRPAPEDCPEPPARATEGQ